MSGFAGSGRVGERRRRRLAVESDGAEPDWQGSSDSGDSLLRFFESAGREASQLTPRDCPVLTVVSARSWKHWTFVFGVFMIGFGLLLAVFLDPFWSAPYGPGVTRLLTGPMPPAVSWGMSLSLFVAAQASMIIWWARSRSLQDFEATYRIWAWAAATWLVFSLCLATQAHLAWSDTVLFHIRWKSPGAALWCWLLPAAAWGWGLGLRLEPELRKNRPGHCLFLLAGAWYMGTAGLLCQHEYWPKFMAPGLLQLLIGVCQMMGHAFLLLSLALHARFVLAFSAEPPIAKRRQSRQTEVAEQAPGLLSKLSLMSLFRHKPAEVATDEADEKPKRGRKKAAASTTKKKSTTRKSRVKAPPAEEEWTAEAADETTDEGAEAWETSVETTTAEQESSPADETAGENEAESNPSDDLHYRFDQAESSDDEEGDGDFPKGLSKREKRKLQQQMRDQERRGKR